jgi:hypothetical protein
MRAVISLTKIPPIRDSPVSEWRVTRTEHHKLQTENFGKRCATREGLMLRRLDSEPDPAKVRDGDYPLECRFSLW